MNQGNLEFQFSVLAALLPPFLFLGNIQDCAQNLRFSNIKLSREYCPTNAHTFEFRVWIFSSPECFVRDKREESWRFLKMQGMCMFVKENDAHGQQGSSMVVGLHTVHCKLCCGAEKFLSSPNVSIHPVQTWNNPSGSICRIYPDYEGGWDSGMDVNKMDSQHCILWTPPQLLNVIGIV